VELDLDTRNWNSYRNNYSKDRVMDKFTVGGRTISISAQLVKEVLEDILASPVNKHFVVVNGRRFPVKQALSIVANIPSSSFISTEAVRVFKNLGFEVDRVGGNREAEKNESEILLEQYLQAHGHGHFQFQPEVTGTPRRPDYLLVVAESQIFLEVKQFEPTSEDFKLQGGAYDPYAPIREKIEAGRKKFKDLEKTTCCLVLFNRGRPLVDLSWRFVYGAMLGRIAVRMPFDPVRGQMVPEQATQGFFGGGGRMRPRKEAKPIEAWNRTISSIIVLEQLALGRRRFLADIRQKEAEQGREFDLEESMAMLEEARGTERDWGLLQLRTVTCENPDARNPLTEELFAGPFDERYGGVNDHIERKFCGDEIKKLEEEEKRAKQAQGKNRKDWSKLPLKPQRAISFNDDTK
jgi:hypothetical protein